MTIKGIVTDKATGKAVDFASAFITRAGDKTAQPLQEGFVADAEGNLEIKSPLLDYKENKDAVDIVITANGYEQLRVSPDEFAVGGLKMVPKKSIIDRTKSAVSGVPMWAWTAGGAVLGATILITIIIKKFK